MFNILKLVCCTVIAIFIVSCTPAERYTTDTRTSPRSRYYSTRRDSFTPSGIRYRTGITYRWVTSYYGDDFHGKKTANGEIYDMYGMTCAHRELPFETILEVINPVNNQTAIVRVNDRGPFIRGRELDLSYGAARRVGLIEKGVKELHIRILELPDID